MSTTDSGTGTSNRTDSLELEVERTHLIGAVERSARAADFIRFAHTLQSSRKSEEGKGSDEGQKQQQQQQPGEDPGPETARAVVDALLLAAECHLNPYFAHVATGFAGGAITAALTTGQQELLPMSAWGAYSDALGGLEEARDAAVVRLLIEAAAAAASPDDTVADAARASGLGQLQASLEEWGSNLASMFELGGSMPLSSLTSPVELPEFEADITTLVRMHEKELAAFLLRELRSTDGSALLDVLLQGLLLLLRSATKAPAPEIDVASTILLSAARLSTTLQSTTSAGGFAFRRQLRALEQLVDAACGDAPHTTTTLSAETWFELLSQDVFVRSPLPLVRYIGWRAVSGALSRAPPTGAREELERWQLLLTVFADEIYAPPATPASSLHPDATAEVQAALAALQTKFDVGSKMYQPPTSAVVTTKPASSPVGAAYPNLIEVFPSLHDEFSAIATGILTHVCNRIGGAPSSAVPSILVWFRLVCAKPFGMTGLSNKAVAAAAKRAYASMVLQLLDELLTSHLEMVMTEASTLLSSLIALCCNPAATPALVERFLESVRPALSCDALGAFEALCLDTLIEWLNAAETLPEAEGVVPPLGSTKSKKPKAASPAPPDMLLFTLAALLPDLSSESYVKLLLALPRWVAPASWAHIAAPVRTIRLRALLSILKAVLTRLRKYDAADSSARDAGKFLLPAMAEALEQAWSAEPQRCSSAACAAAEVLALGEGSFSVGGGGDDHHHDNNGTDRVKALSAAAVELQAKGCWRVAHAALESACQQPCLAPTFLGEKAQSAASMLAWALVARARSACRLEWRAQAPQLATIALQRCSASPASSALMIALGCLVEHPEPEVKLQAIAGARAVLVLLAAGFHDSDHPNDGTSSSSAATQARALATAVWQPAHQAAGTERSARVRSALLRLLRDAVPHLAQAALAQAAQALEATCPALVAKAQRMPGAREELALVASIALQLAIAPGAGEEADKRQQGLSLVPSVVWDGLGSLAPSAVSEAGEEPAWTPPEAALAAALVALKSAPTDAAVRSEATLALGAAAVAGGGGGDQGYDQQPRNQEVSEEEMVGEELATVRAALLEVRSRVLDAEAAEAADVEASLAAEREREELAAEVAAMRAELALNNSGGCPPSTPPPLLPRPSTTSTAPPPPPAVTASLRAELATLKRAAVLAAAQGKAERSLARLRERERLALEEENRLAALSAELDAEAASAKKRELQHQRALVVERERTRELQRAQEIDTERRTQAVLASGGAAAAAAAAGGGGAAAAAPATTREPVVSRTRLYQEANDGIVAELAADAVNPNKAGRGAQSGGRGRGRGRGVARS